jgi:hypothetical protein
MKIIGHRVGMRWGEDRKGSVRETERDEGGKRQTMRFMGTWTQFTRGVIHSRSEGGAVSKGGGRGCRDCGRRYEGIDRQWL